MPTPPVSRTQRRGEALAATLPALLVAAERVAATVAQGVHGRRRVGQGETFWQFRQYEPGDTPQLIDWRQTAKSDRVYVRELEWEAAQSIWLWRDTSASMDWRSARNLPSKRERAEMLLLALVVLLIRAGERVALLGTGRLPATGRHTLVRMVLRLEREREQQRPGPGLPAPEDLPRHGETVLLGDFLAPIAEIERGLRFFAERGVKGHLLQILDPAEAALPYRGRIRFTGLEQEEPWLLSRAETVRQAYLERLQRQQEAIGELTRRLGWTAQVHHTDRSAESALLALYTALSRLPGG